MVLTAEEYLLLADGFFESLKTGNDESDRLALAKIHQARMHVFSHFVLFLERKLDV